MEKGGRERQVAVTGALFENDPRIAVLAVLTGEVIGFAFEAQVGARAGAAPWKPCSTTGAPASRGLPLLSRSPPGNPSAARVHRGHGGTARRR